MKLIFEHSSGSEGCGWSTTAYPFEYESKDKFVFDLLESTKDWRENNPIWDIFKVFSFIGDYYFPFIELTKEEIEEIEKNIFTLDEWFEKEKVNHTL